MNILTELLENITTLEIAAATILCMGTVILTYMLIRKLYGNQKDRKANGCTDTGNPDTKTNHDFAHCKLNDILGYDFVKMQTPVVIIPENTGKQEKDTQKTRETDMPHPSTTQRMGVTGAYDNRIDDEPEETQQEMEKRKAIHRQLQMERELEREAERNNASVLPDAWNTVRNMDWPSNDAIIDELDKRNQYFEDEPFLSEEMDEEQEQDNSLADTPQNPELYADIESITGEQLKEMENQLQQGLSESDRQSIADFEAKYKNFVNTKPKNDGNDGTPNN